MKKDNYSVKQENINVKLLTIEENGEIKQFKFDENVARACLQYVIAKALDKNKKKSK